MENLLKDATRRLFALHAAFDILDDYSQQQAGEEIEKAIQDIVELQYEVQNGYLGDVFDIAFEVKGLLDDIFDAYFSLANRKKELTLQVSLLKEALEAVTALLAEVLKLD